MAIEEQANNAIPTGGVTDVAENPNDKDPVDINC